MIELIAYCLYLIGAVGLFVFFMGLSSSWDNGPRSFIDWAGIIAIAVFWPIAVLGWLIFVAYSIVSDEIADIRKKNANTGTGS
jgi:hypothetical protein